MCRTRLGAGRQVKAHAAVCTRTGVLIVVEDVARNALSDATQRCQRPPNQPWQRPAAPAHRSQEPTHYRAMASLPRSRSQRRRSQRSGTAYVTYKILRTPQIRQEPHGDSSSLSHVAARPCVHQTPRKTAPSGRLTNDQIVFYPPHRSIDVYPRDERNIEGLSNNLLMS